MPVMPTAALGKALDFVLHGSLPSTSLDIRIFDYGDEPIFRELWLNGLEADHPTIHGDNYDWTEADQQMLIIGNEPPTNAFAGLPESLRGINFRSHFTATSWLAAWKVKFPESRASIAVIDPRASSLASGVSRALQAILGARDAAGHTLVPRAAVLNAPSLATICQWLHDSAKDTSRATAPHLRDLLQATIWNELTSNREQHHALSNVLGAFLLSESSLSIRTAYQSRPASPQRLLNTLVRTISVMTNGDIGEGPSWLKGDLGKLVPHTVLIDDMADLWQPVLERALSFNSEGQQSGVPVFSLGGKGGSFAEGLGGLPGRLKTLLPQEGSPSHRPNLRIKDLLGGKQDPPDSDNFILFLDLRLFPRGADGQPGAEERKFLRELAEFGQKLLKSEQNLPWLDAPDTRRAFDAELADLIEKPPPKGSSASLSPKQTVTLLPRLISLLDPTLPIVLFSSTHRTELVEPFRGYGNIITGFRKPVISGMSGDWKSIEEELRADFVSALEQAERIQRVRTLVQDLVQKNS